MKDQNERKERSLQKRIQAAQIAHHREDVYHEHNGDEFKFQHPHGMKSFLMSFTKGLCHDETTGLVKDPNHYLSLVRAIETGDPWDFENTPLGPVCTEEANALVPDWKSEKALTSGKDNGRVSVRAWESASAGLVFDLQAPDAQAVTMPPVPKLGSDELTAEIAEVYAQALLRDVPLTSFFVDGPFDDVERLIDKLNNLSWFAPSNVSRTGHRDLTRNTIFRGITEGDNVGPYLSQFLLAGDTGRGTGDKNGKEFFPSEGKFNYGAMVIDQKVRNAIQEDHMTTWDEWLDVQNGANLGGLEDYVSGDNGRRFITTGRDLATYVHYDALYQAYLNACLLLLSLGAPFDPGIPFQESDDLDHQQGFAHYGPPHILTLVTEVATRALKAVRYQKFNIHRRIRPEVLAARLEKRNELRVIAPELQDIYNDLEVSGLVADIRNNPNGNTDNPNMLLPMAFCEGSPMHPSYGAGHATVAGACVTILKAFFDCDQFLDISENGQEFKISSTPGQHAFVPNEDGQSLETVLTNPLSVGGELNKLAANISIGRNWAGVHYFSDYEQSLYMGEEIAIGMLQEQSITYNPLENATMSLKKFNGENIRIRDGKIIHPDQLLTKSTGIVKVKTPIV